MLPILARQEIHGALSEVLALLFPAPRAWRNPFGLHEGESSQEADRSFVCGCCTGFDSVQPEVFKTEVHHCRGGFGGIATSPMERSQLVAELSTTIPASLAANPTAADQFVAVDVSNCQLELDPWYGC